MFDSPFERCPVCGQFVMLDQTQAQCAREHHCHPAVDCPLRKYFTGHDFGEKKRQQRAAPKIKKS